MTSDESTVIKHARRELDAVGLLDPDSDYDGMLGQAVMDLIRVFSEQGHSGYSASATIELFHELAQFKNISPLTDRPEEWEEIHDGIASEPDPLWQSRRRSEAFSHDGGKTYYLLTDPMNPDGTLPTYTTKTRTEEGADLA